MQQCAFICVHQRFLLHYYVVQVKQIPDADSASHSDTVSIRMIVNVIAMKVHSETATFHHEQHNDEALNNKPITHHLRRGSYVLKFKKPVFATLCSFGSV